MDGIGIEVAYTQPSESGNDIELHNADVALHRPEGDDPGFVLIPK